MPKKGAKLGEYSLPGPSIIVAIVLRQVGRVSPGTQRITSLEGKAKRDEVAVLSW